MDCNCYDRVERSRVRMTRSARNPPVTASPLKRMTMVRARARRGCALRSPPAPPPAAGATGTTGTGTSLPPPPPLPPRPPPAPRAELLPIPLRRRGGGLLRRALAARRARDALRADVRPRLRGLLRRGVRDPSACGGCETPHSQNARRSEHGHGNSVRDPSAGGLRNPYSENARRSDNTGHGNSTALRETPFRTNRSDHGQGLRSGTTGAVVVHRMKRSPRLLACLDRGCLSPARRVAREDSTSRDSSRLEAGF